LKIDPSSFDLLSGENLDEDESVFFHPSRSKKIVSVLDTKESQAAPHLTMKDAIGAVGELHPYLGRLYGIENQRVAVLILDMAKLFALKKKPLEAVLLSMYPSSDIDLCFIADQMTTAREIETVLREAAGTYLESIRLIDSYENRDNSLRARSLTFRLRLANRQSTFTEEELRGIWNDCVKAVSDRLHIKLREN
jgi:phenylalanyl-tRNA synthetase beta chain